MALVHDEQQRPAQIFRDLRELECSGDQYGDEDPHPPFKFVVISSAQTTDGVRRKIAVPYK